VLRALEGLHARDLYLAYACKVGDPNALAWFEARLLTEVSKYVARIDA
jgi:hypothetical protein